MVKRAHFYYQNSCSTCEEAQSFLEENGVLLTLRDVGKSPLTKRELTLLLGDHDPRYYLNNASSIYKKHKYDQGLPPHDELLEVIMEHPDLLIYPIVVSGRLMTIGSNRKQLTDMLQLNISGNGTGKNNNIAGTSK